MRRTILLFTLMAAALLVGSGVALAATVSEVEPNNSLAEAQNIDNSFSLDSDPNIGNMFINTSEIVPHATVNGTGNDTVDYYKFTVSQAGDGVILDVDGALVCDEEFTFCDGFDSWVELYDSSGQRSTYSDDSSPDWGQGGSLHSVDSYLEHEFQAPGTYYAAFGSYPDLQPIPAVGFNGGATSYQLQVSLGELPVMCQGQFPTIQAQSGRAVKGTRGDDIIAGTQGPDTINGNGGNDTICGRFGNDSTSGGDGDDSMFGGDGNDRIMGERGSDNLYGESGDDTLDGGLGPDYIDGGDGTDKCSLGENGRDQCELAIGPNVNP